MIAKAAAPGHQHRPCRKIPYPNKTKALRHMRKLLQQGRDRGGRRWCAAYRCPFCHFWHLTSRKA